MAKPSLSIVILVGAVLADCLSVANASGVLTEDKDNGNRPVVCFAMFGIFFLRMVNFGDSDERSLILSSAQAKASWCCGKIRFSTGIAQTFGGCMMRLEQTIPAG